MAATAERDTPAQTNQLDQVDACPEDSTTYPHTRSKTSSNFYIKLIKTNEKEIVSSIYLLNVSELHVIN